MSPIRHLLAAALFALFALAAVYTPAHAQSCGTTLTGSVTLHADLHCSTGWMALSAGADDITIHLNGHTISGSNALQGIHVVGYNRVRIVGPGTISGFWGGVNAFKSDRLAVDGVTFTDLGVPVIAKESAASTIKNNRFSGRAGGGFAIQLLSDAGGRPDLGGHAILDNHVDGFDTGLEVCGKPFSGNTVAGNMFSNISNSAVFLRDGSSSNNVTDNTIEDSRNGIVIDSGISNEVTYNLIQRGSHGIGLWPQLSGGCNAGGATVPTIGVTLIAYNEIAKQHTAVSLGSNLKLRRVLKNRIGKNLLQDNSYGLWFNADTADNDGRDNFYPGTAVPVTDDGIGNTY